MAEEMAIEKTVAADFEEVMSPASFVTHRDGEDLGSEPDYSLPGRVAIKAEIASSSLDQGNAQPAGFPRVAVTLSCETHSTTDDPTREKVQELAGLVRECIETETVIDDLTAAAGVATYYTVQVGRSFDDDEGRIRRLVLTYTVIMRPSN